MTRRRFLPLAALALCLSACAAGPRPAPAAPADGIARAGIGQTVSVDGPRVTPLAVLEDSRCPINARCVWAGRLRLSVRITLGSGDQLHEMTLGEPLTVADGNLELVEALPLPVAGAAPAAGPYRFGFRFAGGL